MGVYLLGSSESLPSSFLIFCEEMWWQTTHLERPRLLEKERLRRFEGSIGKL